MSCSNTEPAASHWDTEPAAAAAAMAERVGRTGAHPATTPADGADAALWAALTEAGFTEIGIPEEHGGSGGSTADALSVLHAVVGRGALTMLLEHTLLAGRLVAECTAAPPSGPATMAVAGADCRITRDGGAPDATPPTPDAVLDGSVTGVVHATGAGILVVVLPGVDEDADERPTVALVATDAPGVTVEPGSDLLGAPFDDIRFDAAPARLFVSPVSTAELRRRGALAYAVALTAAAGTVRERTLRYAAERVQFGRPLAAFQAVQQRLAGLAARTALMETATAAAIADADSALARTSIAAAKAVTSAAAREIAAAGHQIHGAIGFTAEYELGRSTTALWNWRERYGSERFWARELAAQILDEGADPWDLVTGAETADTAEEVSR
ncbi:MAG TPA: acyl-CoA dehydrogenase family protein [Nocardia sp.]|uniref:acyl-CoA dehydrogenase family protein n=1 Tax=Nocardia sp. TaxID=1821 RepID=UPI002B4ACC75|nr:acyl-CoA dehydrogenase family protein [Nocardia sp.]HLS77657.1 acyl-CoA dehydrogenase family protein [Nocardia sp.]